MPQIYLLFVFLRCFIDFRSKIPPPHILLLHVATTQNHEENKVGLFNTNQTSICSCQFPLCKPRAVWDFRKGGFTRQAGAQSSTNMFWHPHSCLPYDSLALHWDLNHSGLFPHDTTCTAPRLLHRPRGPVQGHLATVRSLRMYPLDWDRMSSGESIHMCPEWGTNQERWVLLGSLHRRRKDKGDFCSSFLTLPLSKTGGLWRKQEMITVAMQYSKDTSSG